ncbi:MAG: endo-1,4-beta-xylanase [Bacteroidaceae bacterium]|nr:endo-1,4-beta-xylanase [Bacteroidaceae bacterium]
MNFNTINDVLANAEKAGVSVYGHTLAWHAQQNTTWLNKLLAPIEIPVQLITDKTVDYTTATSFDGTITKAGTVKIEGGALHAVKGVKFYLIEGFPVEGGREYEISFTAKVDKTVNLTLNFCGTKLDTKVKIEPSDWNGITVKCKAPADSDNGYLEVDPSPMYGGNVYYSDASVAHYPDNTRPQTAEEMRDTLTSEMNRWVDGMMSACAGRVQAWDLINEAISGGGNVNGYYDLQHSTPGSTDFFWQDYLGSEQYGPIVEQAARKAWAKYGGKPEDLKLFINDYNLESDWDQNKKLSSLIYWIGVWEKNGAKIDGIGSQMHVSYYANESIMRSKAKAMVNMMHMMANTGKLVRISELDMGYVRADGTEATALDITAEERQQMADYYRFIIQMYLKIVPPAQQYGLCQWCLTDSKPGSGWRAGEPVGLWTTDWVRTVCYAAYCDALSQPLPETEDFFQYIAK